AAVVATCNALSSADLAAVHPQAGGSYVYAGVRIGPWSARLAGSAFLVGKTASAAAAAGAFGAYVVPAAPTVAAVALVAAMTAINTVGVRWTARVTWVLVTVVLLVLALVVVAGLLTDAAARPAGAALVAVNPDPPPSPAGVLAGAGLLFFAFAGYARMATLGEEVRDPARSLRRAIPLALAIALVVYLLVALAALRALGPEVLASATAPLADVVAASTFADLTAVVRIGAAVATMSVLLSVLVGVSRTTLAMARGGDLPAALTTIGRRGTPWRADLAGGAVAAVLAVLAGPAAAIALSAGCVLVYYAVTNAAAMRLRPHERRWPRWTSYLGFFLCLLLAFTLQVLTTALVLGVAVCVVALSARRRGGSVPGS
ncbi:MAG: APC family permease, partial [Actinomycetota bacterium]|nr:APC family permease [Actinomycetota bacterium]